MDEQDSTAGQDRYRAVRDALDQDDELAHLTRHDLEPDTAERLLDAVDRALEQAVNLAEPRLTAARCLSIAARVQTGRVHGPAWVVDQLDQLTTTYANANAETPS